MPDKLPEGGVQFAIKTSDNRDPNVPKDHYQISTIADGHCACRAVLQTMILAALSDPKAKKNLEAYLDDILKTTPAVREQIESLKKNIDEFCAGKKTKVSFEEFFKLKYNENISIFKAMVEHAKQHYFNSTEVGLSNTAINELTISQEHRYISLDPFRAVLKSYSFNLEIRVKENVHKGVENEQEQKKYIRLAVVHTGVFDSGLAHFDALVSQDTVQAIEEKQRKFTEQPVEPSTQSHSKLKRLWNLLRRRPAKPNATREGSTSSTNPVFDKEMAKPGLSPKSQTGSPPNVLSSEKKAREENELAALHVVLKAMISAALSNPDALTKLINYLDDVKANVEARKEHSNWLLDLKVDLETLLYSSYKEKTIEIETKISSKYLSDESMLPESLLISMKNHAITQVKKQQASITSTQLSNELYNGNLTAYVPLLQEFGFNIEFVGEPHTGTSFQGNPEPRHISITLSHRIGENKQHIYTRVEPEPPIQPVVPAETQQLASHNDKYAAPRALLQAMIAAGLQDPEKSKKFLKYLDKVDEFVGVNAESPIELLRIKLQTALDESSNLEDIRTVYLGKNSKISEVMLKAMCVHAGINVEGPIDAADFARVLKEHGFHLVITGANADAKGDKASATDTEIKVNKQNNPAGNPTYAAVVTKVNEEVIEPQPQQESWWVRGVRLFGTVVNSEVVTGTIEALVRLPGVSSAADALRDFVDVPKQESDSAYLTSLWQKAKSGEKKYKKFFQKNLIPGSKFPDTMMSGEFSETKLRSKLSYYLQLKVLEAYKSKYSKREITEEELRFLREKMDKLISRNVDGALDRALVINLIEHDRLTQDLDITIFHGIEEHQKSIEPTSNQVPEESSKAKFPIITRIRDFFSRSEPRTRAAVDTEDVSKEEQTTRERAYAEDDDGLSTTAQSENREFFRLPEIPKLIKTLFSRSEPSSTGNSVLGAVVEQEREEPDENPALEELPGNSFRRRQESNRFNRRLSDIFEGEGEGEDEGEELESTPSLEVSEEELDIQENPELEKFVLLLLKAGLSPDNRKGIVRFFTSYKAELTASLYEMEGYGKYSLAELNKAMKAYQKLFSNPNVADEDIERFFDENKDMLCSVVRGMVFLHSSNEFVNTASPQKGGDFPLEGDQLTWFEENVVGKQYEVLLLPNPYRTITDFYIFNFDNNSSSESGKQNADACMDALLSVADSSSIARGYVYALLFKGEETPNELRTVLAKFFTGNSKSLTPDDRKLLVGALREKYHEYVLKFFPEQDISRVIGLEIHDNFSITHPLFLRMLGEAGIKLEISNTRQEDPAFVIMWDNYDPKRFGDEVRVSMTYDAQDGAFKHEASGTDDTLGRLGDYTVNPKKQAKLTQERRRFLGLREEVQSYLRTITDRNERLVFAQDLYRAAEQDKSNISDPNLHARVMKWACGDSTTMSDADIDSIVTLFAKAGIRSYILANLRRYVRSEEFKEQFPDNPIRCFYNLLLYAKYDGADVEPSSELLGKFISAAKAHEEGTLSEQDFADLYLEAMNSQEELAELNRLLGLLNFSHNETQPIFQDMNPVAQKRASKRSMLRGMILLSRIRELKEGRDTMVLALRTVEQEFKNDPVLSRMRKKSIEGEQGFEAEGSKVSISINKNPDPQQSTYGLRIEHSEHATNVDRKNAAFARGCIEAANKKPGAYKSIRIFGLENRDLKKTTDYNQVKNLVLTVFQAARESGLDVKIDPASKQQFDEFMKSFEKQHPKKFHELQAFMQSKQGDDLSSERSRTMLTSRSRSSGILDSKDNPLNTEPEPGPVPGPGSGPSKPRRHSM